MKPKRGLVLEGGGAKGAYAFGAILALRDLGIEFDAVAGTSVGALNAAFLSTAQFDVGKEIWRSMSFKSVCRPNFRFIPMWLLLPFHILGMLFQHVALPFSSRLPPREAFMMIILFTGVPLSISVLVTIALMLFSREIQYVSILLAILPLYIALIVLWSVPFIFRAKGYTIFHVSPLKHKLELSLEQYELKIPTYVTITHRKLAFDPDNPGFYEIGGDVGYIRGAMGEEIYVPTYSRLDNLSTVDRTKVLLASSALPFGIFPSIMFDGEYFIDGGLADNCPLYPLVTKEKCESVIIIRLRPEENGFAKRAWQIADRMLRLSNIPEDECRSMYRAVMKQRNITSSIDKTIDPPINVPYRDPDSWPKEVIVIAPRKSLGGFLRGTMNFNARYANRLMGMGYKDAMQVMALADMSTIPHSKSLFES